MFSNDLWTEKNTDHRNHMMSLVWIELKKLTGIHNLYWGYANYRNPCWLMILISIHIPIRQLNNEYAKRRTYRKYKNIIVNSHNSQQQSQLTPTNVDSWIAHVFLYVHIRIGLCEQCTIKFISMRTLFAWSSQPFRYVCTANCSLSAVRSLPK